MGLCMPILISLSSSLGLKFLVFQTQKSKKKLPPGPPTLSLLGNLLWIGKSLFAIEPVRRQLRAKYVPTVTLHIGSWHTPRHPHRPSLSRPRGSRTHVLRILRPPTSTEAARILNANQLNISAAAYGPLGRLLLHPSRAKSFTENRKWVLEGQAARVVECFQHAICLLLFMCFGEKLEESAVEEIERVHRRFRTNSSSFNVFAIPPRLGRFIFRKRWKTVFEIRDERERVLTPLIRSRRGQKDGCEDEKN